MNIFFIFIFSINLILNTVTNQGLFDMSEMFLVEQKETATEETKDEFSESKAESTFEEDLLNEINNYRVKNKLEKLTFDKLLNELSKEHSEYMSERDDLSHDNFGERFKKSKKMSCVENVGWNYHTGKDMFEGWRTSSGHNKNMLNSSIKYAGLSKVGNYITFFACQ